MHLLVLRVLRWSNILPLFNSTVARSPRHAKRNSSIAPLECLEERALLSAVTGIGDHTSATVEKASFEYPNVAGHWSITGVGNSLVGTFNAEQKASKVTAVATINLGDPANLLGLYLPHAKFKKNTPTELTDKGKYLGQKVTTVFTFDSATHFSATIHIGEQTYGIVGAKTSGPNPK